MRIYKAEKEAGIDFQIEKNGSSTTFVTAQVQVCNIKEHFDGMSALDLIKATDTVQTVEELLGNDQPDLALVVAILVSTGWNLNDDIFTPEEVWKARSSPLHKPMNDNHDATKILGHIVQSRVLDKLGNEINLEIPPAEFDLEVAGVLYRAFPELVERIDEIIAKAKTGEIFVSMEAWFPDFGYGLIDATTGETKLIERTEDTAFLTKHLRIYGGTGDYQGYKVGRVLKDIIFGAQGFVDTPANLESVIKVAANQTAVSPVFVTAKLSELLEGGVQDVDEKQFKELQIKLEESQAALEGKEKEIVELQKAAKDYAALVKKVDEMTASTTEASEKKEAIEAEKVELQKQFDKMSDRATKSEAELDKIRKNETARERLVKLSEIKKIEDEEATLAELREMTKETFEVVLKYAGEVKAENVVDNKTTVEDEAEQVTAALSNVKEDESAEFNATEDTKQSEDDSWVAMAKAICGCQEKDEGGE